MVEAEKEVIEAFKKHVEESKKAQQVLADLRHPDEERRKKAKEQAKEGSYEFLKEKGDAKDIESPDKLPDELIQPGLEGKVTTEEEESFRAFKRNIEVIVDEIPEKARESLYPLEPIMQKADQEYQTMVRGHDELKKREVQAQSHVKLVEKYVEHNPDKDEPVTDKLPEELRKELVEPAARESISDAMESYQNQGFKDEDVKSMGEIRKLSIMAGAHRFTDEQIIKAAKRNHEELKGKVARFKEKYATKLAKGFKDAMKNLAEGDEKEAITARNLAYQALTYEEPEAEGDPEQVLYDLQTV